MMFAQKTRWKYFRVLLSTFNYTLSVVFFIPALLTVPEQNMAMNYVLQVGVEKKSIQNQITFQNYLYLPPDLVKRSFIFAIEFKWVVFPVATVVLIYAAELNVVVALLSRNMKNTMKMATYSKQTAMMQKKFIQAMYIQVGQFILISSLISVSFRQPYFFSIYNCQFCIQYFPSSPTFTARPQITWYL